MNQQQLNKLAMYKAVLQYFDDNTTPWQGEPPVAMAVQELRTLTNALDAKSLAQDENSTEGHTSAKDAAIEDMLLRAVKMAKKLKAFALTTHDDVLLQAVNYSKSELAGGPEQLVLNRCTIIAGKATAALAATPPIPAAYKVAAADIAALQAAVSKAAPLAAERDKVYSERTTATASIPVLISNARIKLELLDTLVASVIEEEHQNFIDTYFVTRRIYDRRGGGGGQEEVPSPPSV